MNLAKMSHFIPEFGQTQWTKLLYKTQVIKALSVNLICKFHAQASQRGEEQDVRSVDNDLPTQTRKGELHQNHF